MKTKFYIGLLYILSSLSSGLLLAQTQASFHIPALYHVGFWVSDITKARRFYHDFLGYEEPYSLLTPQGDLQMVVMKVSEQQVIYLFPNSKKILPNGDNLDHLGLITDNLSPLYQRMTLAGIKVKPVHKARIGDLVLTCSYPDGHVFEITQFETNGELMKHQGLCNSETRISNALVSATLSVKDLDKSLQFYKTILGFKIKHINVGYDALISVPDGSDTLHLIQTKSTERALLDYKLEALDITKANAILHRRASTLGFVIEEIKVNSSVTEIRCKDQNGTIVVIAEKSL